VLPLFRCDNHRTYDRAFVLGWWLPSGVGRVFASIYAYSGDVEHLIRSMPRSRSGRW
jgi:hypothetical protein